MPRLTGQGRFPGEDAAVHIFNTRQTLRYVKVPHFRLPGCFEATSQMIFASRQAGPPRIADLVRFQEQGLEVVLGQIGRIGRVARKAQRKTVE
jgi:hypothetical protein